MLFSLKTTQYKREAPIVLNISRSFYKFKKQHNVMTGFLQRSIQPKLYGISFQLLP